VNNPVYADLFLLNSSNLRLNAEQAKAILPLVEQMKNADSAANRELARQVYAQLNSQQYQALLTRGNSRSGINSRWEHHPAMMNRTKYHGTTKDQSLRLAALPDLVVKQLQEIASGQAAVQETPAAPRPIQNPAAPPASPGVRTRPAP